MRTGVEPVGHLLAMLLVLLPFGLLVTLLEWQRQIRIGASRLSGIRRTESMSQRTPGTPAGLVAFEGDPPSKRPHLGRPFHGEAARSTSQWPDVNVRASASIAPSKK